LKNPFREVIAEIYDKEEKKKAKEEEVASSVKWMKFKDEPKREAGPIGKYMTNKK